MPQSPSWDRVGAVELKPLAKKILSTPKHHRAVMISDISQSAMK